MVVEKRWYRLKIIGEGACVTVWLEVDREGRDVATVERAVKEIRKNRMRAFQLDIEMELLAIAKLSKVCCGCKLLKFYNNSYYSTKIKDSSLTYLDGLTMMRPFSWLWNTFHMAIWADTSLLGLQNTMQKILFHNYLKAWKLCTQIILFTAI
jgi:hypothetical protein